jgi:hypothetical protein
VFDGELDMSEHPVLVDIRIYWRYTSSKSSNYQS